MRVESNSKPSPEGYCVSVHFFCAQSTLQVESVKKTKVCSGWGLSLKQCENTRNTFVSHLAMGTPETHILTPHTSFKYCKSYLSQS